MIELRMGAIGTIFELARASLIILFLLSMILESYDANDALDEPRDEKTYKTCPANVRAATYETERDFEKKEKIGTHTLLMYLVYSYATIVTTVAYIQRPPPKTFITCSKLYTLPYDTYNTFCFV